jgi:purine-binding chemotaxis protein CheW
MSETVTLESRSTHAGGRFLTFYLAAEEYGVEILKVREIIGMLPITRVPRTPPAVQGVINLRGKVIPVLDLKARLEMTSDVVAERPCIIVVQAQGVELGVLVDRVSEVANIPAEAVEEVPQFGMEVDTRFLLGIAKSEGRVKLLLDIDRVLTRQEVEALVVDEAEIQPED